MFEQLLNTASQFCISDILNFSNLKQFRPFGKMSAIDSPTRNMFYFEQDFLQNKKLNIKLLGLFGISINQTNTILTVFKNIQQNS